ncbi:MAG: sulfatase-like hydrolase/transferase [Acidobacteria bacterium]|nr:sulfatase-like hydrolase/transferase [Acidobacteriota bacterium]
MGRFAAGPVWAPVFALAGVAVLFGACGGRSRQPDTIVLVTIDTLRADRVGCYGRPNAGTPQFDELAANGVLFAQAQTTAPITVAAHTSILTGRSLPAHRVYTNAGFVLPKEVPTLGESFREAGYATAAFVSSKILAQQHGLDRGFDVYDDEMPGRDPRAGNVQFHVDERAGVQTVERALAWLSAVGGGPAFVWVHLWEPHTPYQPPPEFLARYGSDLYQGEVAAADVALRRLVEGVRASRQGKLLVVVAGDHGESLGEHGEAAHGVFLYNAVMHVPLVIAGESWGVRAKQEVRETVSLADLAPTLLEIAGLPALPYSDGVSLAPILRGTGPVPPRDGVWAESHLPRLEYDWSGLRAFTDGKLKLIEAPRPELYDVVADPQENIDLAAERGTDLAARRRSLQADLARARAAAPAESATAALDEEDMAALRGLGYVSAGRRAKPDAGELVDPARTDPKDRREFMVLFHEAVTASQNGQAAKVLPLFDQLEQVEPKNLTLLLEKGNALIGAGRFDDALALFQRGVAVDPEFVVGWHRIGQLLDQRHDVRGAEAAYRKAVEADPDTVMSLKALAAICYSQGRYKEGMVLLERVLKLDPNDPRVTRDLQLFKARLAES